MTYSTKVAWRRGYDQDDVVQETRKGRTFGKRCWKGPECNNGIRDRGPRQQLRGNKRIENPGIRLQLHLKIKRTSEEFDMKAFRLKITKQVVRISSGLWRMMEWTLWRGRPPLRRRKRGYTLSKSQRCGSTNHSRSYGPPLERENKENLWIMVRTWTNWNLIREPLWMSWP
jgi:hypothetical protein